MEDNLDLRRALFRMGERSAPPADIAAVEMAVGHLLQQTDTSENLGLDDILLATIRGGNRDAAVHLLHAIGDLLVTEKDHSALMTKRWCEGGRVPFGEGYDFARGEAIEVALRNPTRFPNGIDSRGLDERIIEYGWLADRLSHRHPRARRVLDAGSVMNHRRVIQWWQEADFGPLSVVTLCHEGWGSISDAVRYEFADLRNLPYRDGWFATVLCISTLEHVGMDTTLYGADSGQSRDPEEEAIGTLQELARVLEPGGTLLVTVPCGEPKDLGWLRIVGTDEIRRYAQLPFWEEASVRFFRSRQDGWREVTAEEAEDATYNGFPGRGEPRPGPEWVAAAECVALVELSKR